MVTLRSGLRITSILVLQIRMGVGDSTVLEITFDLRGGNPGFGMTKVASTHRRAKKGEGLTPHLSFDAVDFDLAAHSHERPAGRDIELMKCHR